MKRNFELEPQDGRTTFKAVQEKLAVTAINPQLGQPLSAEELVALEPAIENLRSRWPDEDGVKFEKIPSFDEMYVAVTENIERYGFERHQRVAGLPGYNHPRQETR